MAGGDRAWMYDVYAAWNAGDLDRFAGFFAADSVYVTSGLFPGLDGSYSGPEGMRRFHADMGSAWERFRLEPGEIGDAGELTVLEVGFRGWGRASGVEVTLDFHHVVVADERKVRFLAAGPSLESALELAAAHGVTPGPVG